MATEDCCSSCTGGSKHLDLHSGLFGGRRTTLGEPTVAPRISQQQRVRTGLTAAAKRSWRRRGEVAVGWGRFEDLIDHKSKHGDCIVPYSHGGLGSWVSLGRRPVKISCDGPDLACRVKHFADQTRLHDRSKVSGAIAKRERSREIMSTASTVLAWGGEGQPAGGAVGREEWGREESGGREWAVWE